MPKLIIYRVDQHSGSFRAFKVYDDGQLIGKISGHGRYDFNLKPGHHCIQVKMFPSTSEEYEVNLQDESDSIELYTGFAPNNIIESIGYNSLKLLPEKEFFKIYKQEAESKFKERVQHHHWVAIPGLMVSIFTATLIFMKPELFSGKAGMSFVLALALGIGAIQLINRKWIISKSFCINKPAIDAATILFIFLGYVNVLLYQITAIIVSIPLLALWVFMRKKYVNQDV